MTVKVLVGTKKAAFIYTADDRRETWDVSAPIYTGWSVFNMAADLRGDHPRLYAAANHWAWGPSVARSDDLGATWDYRTVGLKFPQEMGQSIENVWCITPGHPSEPGVVYAGTQPAGLFRSEDWGQTWAPVEGLNRHETQPTWSMTGGGASSLNSIEIDPRDHRRMYAAVSAGGSFITEDGGKTWSIISTTAVPTNAKALAWNAEMERELKGDTPLAAMNMPERQVPDGVDPLAIDEMHKMRIDPKNPDRIWTQTHVGVFRSDDCGRTWMDVTRGLPSFHGFPIAVTKQDPDAVFVVPLAMGGLYDNFRVADGHLEVYRTRDAGDTWEALTRGLPGPHDYQSVYREGLSTDGLAQEGVYIGTSNGAVYASADGGDHWQRLPGTLPPILSVTAVVI
jgi:photosystem II stability/assembly factor-like uncharacterized protein